MSSDDEKKSGDSTSTERIPLEKGSPSQGSFAPHIVLMGGLSPTSDTAWWFDKKSHTLGRSKTSDICIAESSISGLHARFVIADGMTSIIDMESTNGTYVNDKQLTPFQSYPLRDRDQIQVGKVLLKYREFAPARPKES